MSGSLFYIYRSFRAILSKNTSDSLPEDEEKLMESICDCPTNGLKPSDGYCPSYVLSKPDGINEVNSCISQSSARSSMSSGVYSSNDDTERSTRLFGCYVSNEVPQSSSEISDQSSEFPVQCSAPTSLDGYTQQESLSSSLSQNSRNITGRQYSSFPINGLPSCGSEIQPTGPTVDIGPSSTTSICPELLSSNEHIPLTPVTSKEDLVTPETGHYNDQACETTLTTPLLSHFHNSADRHPVKVTVYTKHKPFALTIEISCFNDNGRILIDPKALLQHSTEHCGIDHFLKPMFGLWEVSSKRWIILSIPYQLNGAIELRVRFTVTIPLSHREFSNDELDSKFEDDLNERAFRPITCEVLSYLFHQRRHQFLQDFPMNKDEATVHQWLRYLIPNFDATWEEDNYDYVLCPALYDELEKQVENCGQSIISLKSTQAKKLKDILPRSIVNEVEQHAWYDIMMRYRSYLIWQRFNHLLKIAKEKLNHRPEKVVLQVAYIGEVEKLEQQLCTEKFLLATNNGLVTVNGDRGIEVVTTEHNFLEICDGDFDAKCLGMKEKSCCDGIKVLGLDFVDLENMTISPEDDSKVFLADILGNHLTLQFCSAKECLEFVECVGSYSQLVVDQTVSYPCLQYIKEKVSVYENVNDQFLVKKLRNSHMERACIYNRITPTIVNENEKYCLLIKTVKNGECIIEHSDIERDENGHFFITECPSVKVPAKSIEAFVEKVSSFGKHLGNEYEKALYNVIKPSCSDRAAVLIRSSASEAPGVIEKMAMPSVKDDGFSGKILDVFTGDFTQSMVTSLRRNDFDRAQAARAECIILTRVGVSRLVEQNFQNELQEAMNILYQVRHHRHIIKQIGNGVSNSWKILQYSQKGNLEKYFSDRAHRGKLGDDDIKIITGEWLIQLFYQLASAVNYMAMKVVPHGGIRAENVTIFRMNPTPFIKLNHPGVRYQTLSEEDCQFIKRPGKAVKAGTLTPVLPLPWLAYELNEVFLDPAEVRNTHCQSPQADIWSLATTFMEIVHLSEKGRSFSSSHKALCLRGPKKWASLYEENDPCLIAPVPSWLEFPQEFKYRRERFSDKTKRCWRKNPCHRPNAQEILLSLSVLVHHRVGKDTRIYPVSPEDGKRPNGKIQSFADSELEFERNLGKGNFGIVKKYKNVSNGKYYAVKDLLQFDHTSVANFIREIRTMLAIDHENIARIEGMTVPTQRIVMAFYDGGCLQEKIRPYEVNDSKLLSKEELVYLAHDIAKGLQELHRIGILHRDLAARNILLKKTNGTLRRYTAVISDFGLSKVLVDGMYYASGNFEKIPALWHPEDPTYTKESDIWSYGVTLWEMFSGIEHKKSIHADHPPKRTNCCPMEVYRLILLCWKKEPQRRIRLDAILETLRRGRRLLD